MKLGVPNQSALGEKRVALVPDVAKKLAARGVEAVVESAPGEPSHMPDQAYTDAGVSVGSAADAWGAEVVAVVRAPSVEEIGRLERGSVRFGFFAPLTKAPPQAG